MLKILLLRNNDSAGTIYILFCYTIYCTEIQYKMLANIYKLSLLALNQKSDDRATCRISLAFPEPQRDSDHWKCNQN